MLNVPTVHGEGELEFSLAQWEPRGIFSTPLTGQTAQSQPDQVMEITKQLAIFLDNRPGTLARLADALAEVKVNIYAISTSDTVDHSVIRLVVSDYRRALHVFEERGTLVVEDDVLMIEGDNRPGSLAKLAHKLANAKINIEYAYCATRPD